MRRPSLRSQLNQIRLWVRQGRTDAWIAHKLDIPIGQLEQFKREHLSEPESPSADAVPDAGPTLEAPEPAEEDEEVVPEPEEAALEPDEAPPSDDSEEAEAASPARRRRRGRRGGRRRGAPRSAVSYEGTFDHGGEGYGLWLDPAVAESQVYAEHWAGHRAVEVTVESDAITIRRVEPGRDEDEGEEEAD